MDYDGTAICGQTVQEVGALAKWPGDNPKLTWYLDTSGYRGSMDAERVKTAYALAFAYWAQVIEINPVRVNSAAEAVIRVTFQPDDGPSGVLAWSYLADNTWSVKTQRFDNSEAWNDQNPQTPTGGIDFVRVACHELGHVLGLDHDAGNANALLRPTYSTSIPKPTDRDVQRIVGLGYKRRTTPPPPPPGAAVPLPPPVGPPVQPDGLLTMDTARKVVTVPAGWQVIKR